MQNRIKNANAEIKPENARKTQQFGQILCSEKQSTFQNCSYERFLFPQMLLDLLSFPNISCFRFAKYIFMQSAVLCFSGRYVIGPRILSPSVIRTILLTWFVDLSDQDDSLLTSGLTSDQSSQDISILNYVYVRTINQLAVLILTFLSNQWHMVYNKHISFW